MKGTPGRPRFSRAAVIAIIFAGGVVASGSYLIADGDNGRRGRWHRRRSAVLLEDLQWAQLQSDGAQRDLAYYSPTPSTNQPMPLVIILHGGGRSAADIWTDEFGQSWRQLADEHGLLLALPEGRDDPSDADDHHWNDCRTGVIDEDANSSENDVLFVSRVIDWMSVRFPVDPDRVYATGASNGGMMTFRLAVQSGWRFAAVATAIANWPDPSECLQTPSPIPILIMNGTDDRLMPWDGGCLGLGGCRQSSVLSTSETVELWRSINRTDETPTIVDLPDEVTTDRSTVRVFTYSNGVDGSEVVLYRVDGGGHNVPGPTQLTALQHLVFGWKNQDIDGPQEIWAFFERHRRPATPVRRPSGRVGSQP